MNQTVLLADGDAEYCDLFQRFFTQHGHPVETASDAVDCLKKLRQRSPAVLVLDLELRWGGGNGVLAWLREEGVMPELAVITTATDGFVPEAAADIKPPVVKFLPKPFALTSLWDSVRAALAEQRRGRWFINSNRAGASPELFLG